MSRTPEIQTQRLVLEPVRVSHAREAWPHLDDERMWLFFPEKRPASLEALEELYRKWERGSPSPDQVWWNWLCRERRSRELVGFMQATFFPQNRMAYIAYAVFPARQRSGLAHEAATAIIAHIRKTCDVEKIVADMDAANVASYRLAESLGFTRVEESAGEYVYELKV